MHDADRIHSAVFATADGPGRPVTCAIDIMEYDESGLYFLTAKGKNTVCTAEIAMKFARQGRLNGDERMTQDERLNFLLRCLLAERNEYEEIPVPDSLAEKRRLLRSLMNVRPPVPAREDFLRVQDAYLKERLTQRGVTRLDDLTPVRPGLYLWQGDITTLAVDAIVNAANSRMLGCFVPCHGCIDNAIHTYAGVQLRLECARLMAGQEEEPAGRAKITKAYNLPCRHVLHTVGPIIWEPSRRQTGNCWPAVTAPAWSWRKPAGCTV